MATYRIVNAEGKRGPAWRAEYASQDLAAEALRVAMGWDSIVLSHSFECDGCDAVSAYETIAECDADEDGAHAPRILRVERADEAHEWTEGDRVEAGEPGTDAYDTGRVMAVRDGYVFVRWTSGVGTWIESSELRPTQKGRQP